MAKACLAAWWAVDVAAIAVANHRVVAIRITLVARAVPPAVVMDAASHPAVVTLDVAAVDVVVVAVVVG